MNKSFIKCLATLALSALVLCMLAACDSEPVCQHQWSEADCLNASSCTLCGEVQAEAMGHDWTEATCESPENCSRCGETQGEASGHSYGKWMLDEMDMYRICTVCENSESAEIDYPLYLKQEIVGCWNLSYIIRDENLYFPDRLPHNQPDTEIIFDEDGSIFSCDYDKKDLGVEWTFDRAAFDSSESLHKIYISAGEALSDAYFSCIDNSITFTMTNSDGDIVVLSKDHGEGIAPLLIGEWAAYSENSIYSISFLEDRSFTADFDGEVSGFWQPRPSGSSSSMATLLLNYRKDGKEKTVYSSLTGFNPGISQQAQKDYMSLSVFSDNRYMTFSLDVKERLTESVEKMDTALLGTWTSIDYTVSSNGAENSGLSTDYSITFLEDGNFTAKLHKDFSGKWTRRDISSDGLGMSYTYHIITSGASEYSYFNVSSDGRGYLYLNTGKENYYYNFKQMNEEELAAQNELIEKAPTMIVGEWFAADNSGIDAAFNEDGTFALNLAGERYNGLWYFNSMHEYSDTIYYYFDMETDYETFYKVIYGPDFDYSSYINPDDPSEYVEESALYLTAKNGVCTLNIESYLCNCMMTDATGLAAAQEAAAAIVGHWSANTATNYNQDTKQGTDVDVDFYIDISEDGSLTGYAGRDIQGTWSYFDSENGVPRYLIEYSGSEMGSMATLNGDCLSAYFNPYIIDFNK